MPETKILLLTGGTGTGKTMALKQFLPELDSSGIRAGGILAPGRYLASGEKEFDLELIPGLKKYFLSTRIQYTGWQTIGGFRFNPEAVEAGLRHLKSLPLEHFHLYLLDEIGPFELDGLLWAPVIPELMDKGVPMIWTVRSSILEQVSSKWDFSHPEIISLEEGRGDETREKIRIWLRKNIQGLS